MAVSTDMAEAPPHRSAHERGPLRRTRAQIMRVLAGLLTLACAPYQARAHGPLPSALSVVRWEGKRTPELVRLSMGLAKRRADDRFEFLCPAQWSDTAGPETLALPDGNAIVAGARGFFVVDEDGLVSPHPEAGELTGGVAISLLDERIMALRVTSDGSEVWTLDSKQAERIWRSEQIFQAMVTYHGALQLARLESGELHLLALDSEGIPAEESSAAVPKEASYVKLRPYTDGMAVLLVIPSGLQLGELVDGKLSVIAEAQNRLAGPLGPAPSLLTVDGQLEALAERGLTPLGVDRYVGCLEQGPDLRYACTTEGISELVDQHLGEPLFAFSQLVAPAYDRVPAGDARTACVAQWEDLRFDLLAQGISVDQSERSATRADRDAAEQMTEDTASESESEPGEETRDAAAQDASPAAGDAAPRQPDAQVDDNDASRQHGCQLSAKGEPPLVLMGTLSLLFFQRRRKIHKRMTAS